MKNFMKLCLMVTLIFTGVFGLASPLPDLNFEQPDKVSELTTSIGAVYLVNAVKHNCLGSEHLTLFTHTMNSDISPIYAVEVVLIESGEIDSMR